MKKRLFMREETGGGDEQGSTDIIRYPGIASHRRLFGFGLFIHHPRGTNGEEELSLMKIFKESPRNRDGVREERASRQDLANLF